MLNDVRGAAGTRDTSPFRFFPHLDGLVLDLVRWWIYYKPIAISASSRWTFISIFDICCLF